MGVQPNLCQTNLYCHSDENFHILSQNFGVCCTRAGDRQAGHCHTFCLLLGSRYMQFCVDIFVGGKLL